MRPSTTVARAALTAAVALAAVPGFVGSRESSPARPVDAVLFDQVDLATPPDAQGPVPFALDESGLSAGALDAADTFAEAGSGEVAEPGTRAAPGLPVARSGWAWRPPRYSLTGYASFYDYGTTAMRDVPRGSIIVICGAAGCIERVVNDYGPAARTGRIIDMYRPDFFSICGCGWWSGTTWVTVRVY